MNYQLFFFVPILLFITGCISPQLDSSDSITYVECAFSSQKGMWCFDGVGGYGTTSTSCRETQKDCEESRNYSLGDMSQCESKPTQVERDNCYWHFGFNNGQLETCTKIVDPLLKSDCIGHYAGVNSKLELCDESPSPDDCYLDAVKWWAPTPKMACEKIINSEKKNLCLSYFTE